MIHRHYSSLDSKRVSDRSVNNILKNDFNYKDHNKLKTESIDNFSTQKPFPI